MRVERLNARVAQLEREKERLDYERQMAQMYLLAAVGPWSDDGSRPTGCELGNQNCRPPAASRSGGGIVRRTARSSSAKSGTVPSIDGYSSQPGHPPSSRASSKVSSRASSKVSSRASSKNRQAIRQGRAGLLARLSRGTGCLEAGSEAASECLSVATSATAGELAKACAPRKNLADVSRPPPGAPHPLREFVMAIRGQRPAGQMPGKLPRSWRTPATGGSSEGSSAFSDRTPELEGLATQATGRIGMGGAVSLVKE